MKKKLKVGFIMGGGVSMGSFSAGALQYVLSSLEENLNKDEFNSCEVDIFTGASAGSVTLTLAIFDRLNHENANYEYAEFNNWLKKLWTEEEWLDISTLATGIKKQNKIALFSDDVINRITEKLSNNVHKLDKNNKGILSDTIHLGMTMTNLNGIPRDLTNVLVRKNGISANSADGKDALMNYASADYRYFKIQTGDQNTSTSIDNRFNVIPLKSKMDGVRFLKRQ